MNEAKRGIVLATAGTLLLALASQAWSQDSSAAASGQPLDTGPNPEDTDSSSAYARQPEPPLPELPAAPTLPAGGYPNCREEYAKGENYIERADLINACTVAIDTYYLKVLMPFRQAMIDHQNEISRLYTEQVAPSTAYSDVSKNGFYTAMLERHDQANPGGALMAEALAAEQTYKADRAYLEDRFCYNTGCGGYKDPVKAFPKEVKAMQAAAMAAQEPPAKAKAAKDNKKKASSKSGEAEKSNAKGEQSGCARARKRGSALGSFLGSAAGAFGGLGRTGSALVTGFSGLMVGEIACKLDEKEQEVASQATVTVLTEEKVGATAEWVSPTREGVSGSSTVTALETEPNGKRCLTITDVAIIDGEETRVSKQMCRGADGGKYMLVA
ncbi:MAG: hypothetical protein IE921_06710 [Rhodobacteraceae bacterium]|nr:hypothetical protein [Paracoccaceae bacterium]